MANKQFSLDSAISQKDFDECGWSNIVEESKDKRLIHLSRAFYQLANNKDHEITEAGRKILFLLSNVFSMRLQPNSINEPFQAFMQMDDGSRSALPCDFSQSDMQFLTEIVEYIPYESLKARVADLLWVCNKPKNPNHARIAIDCYTKSGVEPGSWYHEGKNNFERAYRLTKQLKDVQRKETIEHLLLEAFNSDDASFKGIVFSVAELIVSLEILDEKRLAIGNRLYEIGESLKSSNKFDDARKFYELSARVYQLNNDEVKYISMSVKVAESLALEADQRFESSNGNKLISSSFFETAIQAYRKIPIKFRDEYSINQRISELRHKLSEAGKFTLSYMGVAHIPVDGAEEFIKLSKEHVSGKKTEYEALIYLSGICPTPNYFALRQQEQENMGTFFFKLLVRFFTVFK